MNELICAAGCLNTECDKNLNFTDAPRDAGLRVVDVSMECNEFICKIESPVDQELNFND